MIMSMKTELTLEMMLALPDRFRDSGIIFSVEKGEPDPEVTIKVLRSRPNVARIDYLKLMS
jgi:hypothetical protein